MTTAPYAKLRANIAGAGNLSGALVGAAGATCQLSQDPAGLGSSWLYEIVDYPEGWAVPAGWTADALSGVYSYLGLTPPSFTLPSTPLWGKIVLRLTVNSGDPGTSGLPTTQFTDKTTVISTPDPSGNGFEDIALGEGDQWDAQRKWVGAMKRNIRRMAAMAGGVCEFSKPVPGQICPAGVPFDVVVTVPVGTTAATVQLGANAPVSLSIVGATATGTLTPAGGDASVAAPLLVVTSGGRTATRTVDVEANAAFWIDSSNVASYAASGGTLTAIKSLVSGTSLSTVTGSPKIYTDPRDGKPAFRFTGSDFVLGTDATYIAAVVGTDKPFCSVEVVEPDDSTGNGFFDSVMLSSSATIGREFGQSGGSYVADQVGAIGYKANNSEKSVAGLNVIVRHSADGLNVYTSLNGEAESLSTITSAGAVTADRVGVGVAAHSTPTYPYSGTIRERLYFSTNKTAPQIAAIVAAMLKKWRPPVQMHVVGDSISTAQLATNGGMTVLLANAVRAAGGTIDPQGPIAVANGYYPYRYSAASGNTCPQMNTRVTDDATGLGKGGSSQGYFRRASLVLLMAGTNPGSPTTAAQTAADYTTLLNNIYARLMQGNTGARIAVTTICDITANRAYSTAFNALLPGIWNVFEAAHPGALIRWSANLALPNDDSNTYFFDGTHPNDAGYVKMCNDPTNGLIQAALPFLMSLQG